MSYAIAHNPYFLTTHIMSKHQSVLIAFQGYFFYLDL